LEGVEKSGKGLPEVEKVTTVGQLNMNFFTYVSESEMRFGHHDRVRRGTGMDLNFLLTLPIRKRMFPIFSTISQGGCLVFAVQIKPRTPPSRVAFNRQKMGG
jgi:hypothetical protein